MSATFDPRQYLADFLIEAGDQLQAFEAALDEAQRDVLATRPLELPTVNRLFRAMHTLKGMAGMLGFSATVTLAHEIESVLEGVRAGKRTLAAVELDALLDVVDTLGRLLESIGTTGGEDGVDVMPAQALLLDLARGKLAPVGPPDLLDRLDPHDQMSILVDVANGQRLFNLTYAGPDFWTWRRGLPPSGRVLGAWADGNRLEEPGESPAAPVEVLFLSSDVVEAIDVQRACGLPPGAVIEAPLPWAAPPAAMVPATATPPEEATRKVAAVAAPVQAPATRVEAARLDRLGELLAALEAEHARLDSLLTGLAILPEHAETARELARPLVRAQERAAELVQELAAARRVSAATLFSRFARPVRELARATGKAVRLEPLGNDVMLDKDVADRLVEPLMHLLRNAVDHGVEPPAERTAAGKQSHGVLVLSAELRENELAVALSDDGRGLDREAVLARARAAGLVDERERPDDGTIDQLIFHPGLSTARIVSDLSGRGVGMDAVRASLEALGGRIELASRPGRGTRVTLCLPASGARTV